MERLENATNEQIELIEDKNTNLSMRTKESLKAEFKNVDGATDNDKLVRLLELHRKFQATQDKFSIDANLDVIDKAFNTITSQLKAISSGVNQYERTLNETYIVDVADEMKLLKEQIESEEVLNARIINLEKELELLNKRAEQNIKIVEDSKIKIEQLEASNKNYIALNSELVSKENNYINQLREKDNTINFKDVENNNLVNDYENKLKSLEEQYKANIVDLEKEQMKKDLEIDNLKNNILNIEKQSEKLGNEIEALRKEHKKDIKDIEKEYKAELKEATLKANKLEIDIVNKDNEIEALKQQIEALKKANESKQKSE